MAFSVAFSVAGAAPARPAPRPIAPATTAARQGLPGRFCRAAPCLKFQAPSSDSNAMDSTCVSGSTDVGAAYAAAMAKRTQDQTGVDGRNALRLIEAALPEAAPAPLPPDATYSVRA